MAPAAAAAPRECELRHTLEGHTAVVTSVAWTKNGRYVMSASHDKSLRLWNPDRGIHVKTYKGPHNHEVLDVVIAEDNAKFVSCGGDKDFFQWDVTSGNVIRKFVGHDRRVNALAYGPDEAVLLSASADKTVRIWDLRTRERRPIQVLSDATDAVLCMCVSGDEIATGSVDGSLRRYDVRMGLMVADKLLQPVGSVSYSNDRACVLASTLDSSVRLIDRDTGGELARFRGHTNQKFKVQSTLDPSNAYVVSGSEDGRVCLWELTDESVSCALSGHRGPVMCARFHEGALVTGSADSTVRVWAAALTPAGAPPPRAPMPGASLGGVLPAAFGRQTAPAGRRRATAPGAAAPERPQLMALLAGGAGEAQRGLAEARCPQPAADGAAAGAEEAAACEPAPAKRQRGDRGRKGRKRECPAE